MDFLTIKIPTQYMGKVAYIMDRYRIPYEVINDSDNDLIKEALRSPVLESLVKGVMEMTKDDFIDVESEDADYEDVPPKYKGRKLDAEEEEE
jgi:hypothetical protein